MTARGEAFHSAVLYWLSLGVPRYIDKHPGGPLMLENMAGKDCRALGFCFALRGWAFQKLGKKLKDVQGKSVQCKKLSGSPLADHPTRHVVEKGDERNLNYFWPRHGCFCQLPFCSRLQAAAVVGPKCSWPLEGVVGGCRAGVGKRRRISLIFRQPRKPPLRWLFKDFFEWTWGFWLTTTCEGVGGLKTFLALLRAGFLKSFWPLGPRSWSARCRDTLWGWTFFFVPLGYCRAGWSV